MNQVSKTTLFTAIALAVSLSTPSAFAKTTVKRAGNSVTIDKPATVISTTTTTPMLIPANPNVATPVAVTPVPVVPTVPTVVVTP